MYRLILLTLLASPAFGNEVPVSGKEAPGLEAFDRAVLAMMERHGIPGASLSIALHGKLVLARGYGWAVIGANRHVEPTTPFGLASVSKTITAAAILRLVEDGKLSLEDEAFGVLKHLAPPRGARVDPRIHKVTVRQLLHHTGGWDRDKSGDPIGWSPIIMRKMGVRAPVSQEAFLRFMMGVPLDFDPGTRAVYSNVGYAILAAIIATRSGMSYEEYVRKNVLDPAGVKAAFLHQGRPDFFKGEAHAYLAGTVAPLPPTQLPMMQGALGWSMSSVDLVRLLTALEGSRGKGALKPETFKVMLSPPPPPVKPGADGQYMAMGFSLARQVKPGVMCVQDGHYYGMRAFVKRNPAGVCWALTFNASMQPDSVDARMIHQAIHEVQDLVESMKKYPKVDLFEEYR